MDAVTHSDMLVAVNSPAHLLRVCAKLMTRRAERLLESLELSLTQLIALMLIELEVAKTSGEIANTLGHNTGATTRTIDQLEARGLLKRHRKMSDRRVITLDLTPEGSQIARDFPRMLVELNQCIWAGFDVSEVRALKLLLMRLMTALETVDRF